jgi:hypothetical protein
LHAGFEKLEKFLDPVGPRGCLEDSRQLAFIEAYSRRIPNRRSGEIAERTDAAQFEGWARAHFDQLLMK